MNLTNEEIGTVKTFINQILIDFGYTRVDKQEDVDGRKFFTGNLGPKPTKMTFILASSDAVKEVIEHLEVYSISVEPSQKNTLMNLRLV